MLARSVVALRLGERSFTIVTLFHGIRPNDLRELREVPEILVGPIGPQFGFGSGTAVPFITEFASLSSGSMFAYRNG